MNLNCPNNIKIHFAACEASNQYLAVDKLGIRYGLYTCFPFVERMVFGKSNAPIIPFRWMKNPTHDIPQNIINNQLHTIQDSGLFTLMFGSQAGKHDEKIINKWYDKLVEFTLQNGGGGNLCRG